MEERFTPARHAGAMLDAFEGARRQGVGRLKHRSQAARGRHVAAILKCPHRPPRFDWSDPVTLTPDVAEEAGRRPRGRATFKAAGMPATDRQTTYHLSHLRALEAEAVHVMREVAAEFE